MTREQAKELLPIIQAFAEGKEIQKHYPFDDVNVWCDGTDDPDFNPLSYQWRIKPESEYRPFVDGTECWNEMLKHQPFGWIKNNADECYFPINFVDKSGIYLEHDEHSQNFIKLVMCYTFADGTPFGIKEL